MIPYINTNYLELVSILETILLLYFFAEFIERKAKLYHYFFFSVICNFIIQSIPVSVFIKLLLYLFLFLFYGIFISKACKNIVILYAVIIFEIMQLCYGISNSLIALISQLVYSISPVKAGLFFMLFGSLLALLLSFTCYYLIKQFFNFPKTESNPYILIILIPILLIFMASEYINHSVYGSTLILNRNGKILNINHLQMFTLQTFGLFSLFCILYAYKKLIDSFQIRTKLSILEQETHFQIQYVKEAKSHYENTKAFRHDFKNHLSIINGFLEKANLEEAKKYLQSIDVLTHDLSFPYHTNNPVLDILLGSKLGSAINSGIHISCSLIIPYPCSVADTDFCIILSNALDNAISACESITDHLQKYIIISGQRHGDFLMIEIQNSYSGKSFTIRGLGLSNIRTVIEKYNGTLSINYENRNFTLSVLLVIPQHPECISQQSY